MAARVEAFYGTKRAPWVGCESLIPPPPPLLFLLRTPGQGYGKGTGASSHLEPEPAGQACSSQEQWQ